jgi:hypothetical protein
MLPERRVSLNPPAYCDVHQSGPFGESLAGVDRATGKPAPMPLGHVFVAIDVEVRYTIAKRI